MNTGTVKWYSAEKGFGFVTSIDGVDAFAHWSAISGDGYRSLETGQSIAFDIENTDRGLRATNITVIYEG